MSGDTWHHDVALRKLFWDDVHTEFESYLDRPYGKVVDRIRREVANLQRRRDRNKHSGLAYEDSNLSQAVEEWEAHIEDVKTTEGLTKMTDEEREALEQLEVDQLSSLDMTAGEQRRLASSVNKRKTQKTRSERIEWCIKKANALDRPEIVEFDEDVIEEEIVECEAEIKANIRARGSSCPVVLSDDSEVEWSSTDTERASKSRKAKGKHKPKKARHRGIPASASLGDEVELKLMSSMNASTLAIQAMAASVAAGGSAAGLHRLEVVERQVAGMQQQLMGIESGIGQLLQRIGGQQPGQVSYHGQGQVPAQNQAWQPHY